MPRKKKKKSSKPKVKINEKTSPTIETNPTNPTATTQKWTPNWKPQTTKTIPSTSVVAMKKNMYATSFESKSYWDERYLANLDIVHEFYKLDFQILQPYLPNVEIYPRVLELGSGNSALGEHMIPMGYQSVVCTDYVSSCIDARISQLNGILPTGLEYKQLDARCIDEAFSSSNCFDVLLEKGIYILFIYL